MVSRTAIEEAKELFRLTVSLTEALEASDLDLAGQLLHERARLLDELPGASIPDDPHERELLEELTKKLNEAEVRNRKTLPRTIATIRGKLAELSMGAVALGGYRGTSVPAGFIDRRD